MSPGPHCWYHKPMLDPKIRPVLSGWRWPAAAILISLSLLFFLLHYNVFFNAFYRSHGDFTGIHFSTNYILNGLLQDLDIPAWQPYQGLGNTDILAYLSYHPLITLFSALTALAGTVLQIQSYSFFQVTFFSFLLSYCLCFAFACYLLARDHLRESSAGLACFAMALFGTQIYFTVYSLNSGIFFLPFVVLFALRLADNRSPAQSFAGLLLSLGLWLSSNTSYYGPALTLLILLVGLLILLRPAGPPEFRKLFSGLGEKALAGMAAAACTAAAMLSLKAVLALRLGEFTSAHKAIASGASYIHHNLEQIGTIVPFKHTNHILPLLENLLNCQPSSAALQEYTYPRLYFGIFPLMLLLYYRRRIQSPYLTLCLAMTLLLFLGSTNPNDGYNLVLPLMAFINPLISMSTRHLNFPVIFAAPFIILAFGFALDAFLRAKIDAETPSLNRAPLAAAALLLVLAAAVVSHSQFTRYLAATLSVSFLALYFPFQRFKRAAVAAGAFALLFVIAEQLIPFRAYAKTFYEPFGRELAAADRFGPNLPGPRLRGFPAPFRHSFSFRFDDSGLITTANNYAAQNNAAFKFFSATRPELLSLSGLYLEEMPYLRGNNKRLFFVNRLLSAKRTADETALTEQLYRKGLGQTAAVIEPLEEGAALPGTALVRGDTVPGAWTAKKLPPVSAGYDGSAELPVGEFRFAGRDGRDPSLQLFRAALPAVFPAYLTSNFLSGDFKDIGISDARGAYSATYFDAFDTERMFQVNHRDKVELILSSRTPPEGAVTVKWRDRFAREGIKVTGFGYNKVSLDVSESGGGLLVYMDRFHRRWKAFIDGKETRIYRTNGQFKGLLVPAGSRTAEFRFSDPLLKAAFILATLAHLLGAAAVLLLGIKRAE